ncbi:MAG: hypothetical protein CMJ68_20040 [Planctomycetaceae bacterium]|nr:hypothetical protein [Planctomycetaceae bacterium]
MVFRFNLTPSLSCKADYFITLVDLKSDQHVFGVDVHGDEPSETQLPLRRHEIRSARLKNTS